MPNSYLEALDALAYSRPHLEPANYVGAYAAYRADQRGNVQALNDYRMIRAHIVPSAEALADLARGSRLSFDADGVSYCAGQYYPVEYRRAAVRLIANAWWRAQAEKFRDPEWTADDIRAQARRTFGRGIARRWFN